MEYGNLTKDSHSYGCIAASVEGFSDAPYSYLGSVTGLRFRPGTETILIPHGRLSDIRYSGSLKEQSQPFRLRQGLTSCGWKSYIKKIVMEEFRRLLGSGGKANDYTSSSLNCLVVRKSPKHSHSPYFESGLWMT
jgi:hypothetical protein